MKKNCYNCTHKDQCNTCTFNSKENYRYYHGMDKHTSYIDDAHPILQTDTSGSEQATTLPEHYEDTFRKFLYDLFDLEPLELLVLQAIMQKKTLTEFSKEFNTMMHKLEKNGMTRFHAFQLRKSILQKMGKGFGQSLLTNGQRKVLKSE